MWTYYDGSSSKHPQVVKESDSPEFNVHLLFSELLQSTAELVYARSATATAHDNIVV